MSGDATLANTGALTLATVNASPGSYTNASVTVNAKGLVTSASSGTAPVTSVSVLAPITDTGTSTAPIIGVVNQGTTTTVLHGNAAGNASFSAVSLTADVSGVLPVANGGTNASSLTAYGALVSNSAGTAVTTVAPGASGNVLKSDGTQWTSGTAGGLQYFTEAQATAAPNNTVYVDSLTATGAVASVDAAFVPKGNGALLGAIPDSTAAGGNKRGLSAVDFQLVRAAAAQVASGDYTVVAGGLNNTASATGAVAAGGSGNTASGQYSTISGGSLATTRGVYGANAYASGQFSTQGDAQTRTFVLRTSTTNATITTLTSDGAAISSTNSVTMPNSSTFGIKAQVVARQTGGTAGTAGDSKYWEVSTVYKRSSGGVFALVGSTIITVIGADTAAAAWTVTVATDAVNGVVLFQGTGETNKNLNWVATVTATEIVG